MSSEPGYTLHNGVTANADNPTSFMIPTAAEKAAIVIGDAVKLFFIQDGTGAERMWCAVTDIDGPNLTGTLANTPVSIDCLMYGDVVKFGLEHVIDITQMPEPVTQPRHLKLVASDGALIPAPSGIAADPDQLAFDDLSGDDDG